MTYYSESVSSTAFGQRIGSQENVNKQTIEKKLPVILSDKLIILFFIGVLFFTLGLSISNGMALAEIDYKKSTLENNIINLQEENNHLEIKIAALSSTERIYEIAVNEIGMISTPPENIKLVNKVTVAELGM